MTSSAQAIEHDEVFWRSAYQAHATTVLGFLRRRVPSGTEAEDLLQEVFVRAIRAGTFRRDGNLRGYLLSIARNLLVNQHRRPRLVVLMDRPEGGSEPLEEVATGDESPEGNAEWREFGRGLRRTLQGMSEAHRVAFELGVLQQKPYSEIARLQGWSLSQVKVNLHRARKKVIEALGDTIPNRAGAAFPGESGGTR